MKIFYLWDQFEYFLKKFSHAKKKFEIKARSIFFSDGATHLKMDAVTMTSDYPLSPYQKAPPLQSDAGDHAQTSVQLSHPPNITPLNFRTDLVVSPSSCHMHFVPQPPSLYLANPPDDTILCSFIPDSIFIVNEDQAIDGVGVAQPECIVIHEEYG